MKSIATFFDFFVGSDDGSDDGTDDDADDAIAIVKLLPQLLQNFHGSMTQLLHRAHDDNDATSSHIIVILLLEKQQNV